MRENNDEGAIVVEASIAVPVYAFIIFTILTLVNICYAQAKVQIDSFLRWHTLHMQVI